MIGCCYKGIFMTEKQLKLVRWIEDLTGKEYTGKEPLELYINRNRPIAVINARENREMNEMSMVDNEILNG